MTFACIISRFVCYEPTSDGVQNGHRGDSGGGGGGGLVPDPGLGAAVDVPRRQDVGVLGHLGLGHVPVLLARPHGGGWRRGMEAGSAGAGRRVGGTRMGV